MKLEIHPVGNPQFVRFVIANDQGEVFDGAGWNKDQNRAMVYNEGQEVARQFNALQERLYEKCPLREFARTTPMIPRGTRRRRPTATAASPITPTTTTAV
jgi:hypothetical protein